MNLGISLNGWRTGAAVAVVLACGISLNSLLRWHARSTQPPLAWKRLPTGWAPLRQGSVYLGRVSANDERDVLVFSDYDCPACKALFEELDSIAAAPGRRTLRVFQLPPAGNPEAMEASLTAICGDMHGRFGQIHRALFANGNRTLPSRNLEVLSAPAGFEDTTALRRCIASPEAKAALDHDLAMAGILGLDVTPIVIIDGTIYRGAPRHLRRMLESSEGSQ